jgi:hypothetical protein
MVEIVPGQKAVFARFVQTGGVDSELSVTTRDGLRAVLKVVRFEDEGIVLRLLRPRD